MTLGVSSSSKKSQPFFAGGTEFSRVEQGPGGRRLFLDPSIRALQERALGTGQRLGAGLGQASNVFQSRANDLRRSLLGNQGALIQAQVRPVAQEAAQRFGGAERAFGRRGLAGSSLTEGALSRIGIQGQEAVADATSKAVAQNINVLAQMDTNQLGQFIESASAQLAAEAGVPLQVAKTRLQGELAAFGIGSAESKSSQFGIGIGKPGGGED